MSPICVKMLQKDKNYAVCNICTIVGNICYLVILLLNISLHKELLPEKRQSLDRIDKIILIPYILKR